MPKNSPIFFLNETTLGCFKLFCEPTVIIITPIDLHNYKTLAHYLYICIMIIQANKEG